MFRWLKFDRQIKSLSFINEHGFINVPSALSAAVKCRFIILILQMDASSGALHPECIALLVAICVMYGGGRGREGKRTVSENVISKTTWSVSMSVGDEGWIGYVTMSSGVCPISDMRLQCPQSCFLYGGYLYPVNELFLLFFCQVLLIFVLINRWK